MITYIIRRLLFLIPVMFGILLVTFMIKAFIPTDAVSMLYMGTTTDEAAAEAMEIMRAEFDLDKPWYVQFAYYTRDIMQGDLGVSIRTRQPVIDEIGYRFVNTIKLTVASLVIAVVIGIGTGIVSAYYKDTWLDFVAMSIGLFGLSMPAFFFGLVLIFVFAVWLRWVPVIGDGGPKHLILPALCLGLIEAAALSRITRSGMIEVLNQDYVRTARAKGLHEKSVIFRHALKNVLLPVITIIGLQVGGLLGGAFIIEVIFGWHGIGELAVKAIQWRDFTITQGIILISAGTYVLVNLVVDIIYTVVDPRINYSE